MKRRTRDAKQNLSNWEKLLSKAKELLSDSRSLEAEVRESTARIEETWDDTASDVERTRRKVSERIDKQASDRNIDARFDSSDIAGPPPAVPETDPSHGDPSFPDQTDYEISDPVTVSEIERVVSETNEREPLERERPVPFTEQEWFKLHSDQFPIGEDEFPIDVREDESDSETEGGRRTGETESPHRERDDRNQEDDR